MEAPAPVTSVLSLTYKLPILIAVVYAAMKLKDAAPWKKSYDKPRQ